MRQSRAGPDVPGLRDATVRATGQRDGTGHPDRIATFLRGLAIGALVGAAIAGSRIWRHRA